jgi:hypothetical protein
VASYVNNTIKRGPMMWMSSTMDGSKQEGKWLIIKCKTLKLTKTNNAPPKRSPWWIPMENEMTMTSPSRLWWL